MNQFDLDDLNDLEGDVDNLDQQDESQMDTIQEEAEEDDEEENMETNTQELTNDTSQADFLLKSSTGKSTHIGTIAKIHASPKFKETCFKIQQLSQSNTLNLQENSPEYRLLIAANTFSVEIINEMTIIQQFIKDNFSERFPELDNILPNPVDYAKVVTLIGNHQDISKIDFKKCDIPSTTILIINISSSTQNPLLSDDKLNRVMEACSMMTDLDASRNILLKYVQSRMVSIAPNLCAIIGANCSAKLMATAGGLTALSKIPACNLQVLGKSSVTESGLSSVSLNRHAGIIYHSDLVSRIQKDYRSKATRMISAKCALAIRIDLSKESQDGIHGMNMKLDIDKKIEKMLEPPPGKSVKALPIPLEGPKKKRAGKRVAKSKEMFAVTELRKAQNRMTFGVAEEEEVGGTLGSTEGLGLVNGNTGRVRAAVADKRVKIKLSKKHKAMTDKLNAVEDTGFQTSLSFTPVQGIELENPDIKRQRVKEANQNWFSGSIQK